MVPACGFDSYLSGLFKWNTQSMIEIFRRQWLYTGLYWWLCRVKRSTSSVKTIRKLNKVLYHTINSSFTIQYWTGDGGKNWSFFLVFAAFPTVTSPVLRLLYDKTGGGGGYLGWVCWGWAAGLSEPQPHYSIIVYSETNYRPHLSHFWANM